MIYLSTGSHDNLRIGSDGEARAWYRVGLTRWLRELPKETTGVVLALESARGVAGIPPKFGGLDAICHATNLRRQKKNQAQAVAMVNACARLGIPGCRILDLFSPTLPWISDQRVYEPGDPVHFQHLGVRWASYLLADVLRSIEQ